MKDPSEVVKAGQKLTVRVLEVDHDRNRISLTARLNDAPESGNPNAGGPRQNASGGGGSPRGNGSRDGRNGGGRNGGGRNGSGRNGGGRNGGGGATSSAGATFTNNPFADLLKKK